MLLTLAWRNVWRNKRRTLIAVAALGLGTAALVFTHSFAETTYATMIDLATRGLLGHLQVHGKGYQADPDIFTTVKDPQAVAALVQKTLPGAAALPRVAGYGLAAAGDRSGAVAIIGLEPALEHQSSRVLQVSEGRLLSDAPAHEVVLGESVARRLKVKPGAELVLLSQAADGSLANDLFKVVGLSKGGGTVEAGGAAVFLHLKDAQSFFALGDGVHQVAVMLPKGEGAKEAAAKLRGAIDQSTLEALSWNEMVPEVELGIEADRQGTFAMDAIVFLLVVLGMFNAMTMATYERMFELGVLGALGTRPGRIMGMIVLESLLLGLFSLVIGLVVGAAVIGVLPPIDMSSMGESEFAGVALPNAIHVSFAPLAAVMSLVTVGFTCFVGGLYPAWRAARMGPVDAMRFRA